MIKVIKKVKNSLKYRFKKIPKTKFDIINYLGKQYNYSSYLEISCIKTGHYFDKVDENIYTRKDCLNYFVPELAELEKYKKGIKEHNIPICSYEQHLNRLRELKYAFDVILVDPYHTYEQSMKDIRTAISLISDRGVIIVHDCNPPEESFTGNNLQVGNWCGNTYKSFIDFKINNPQLEFRVVDTDYGCGIIRKNIKSINTKIDSYKPNEKLEWNYFVKNRKSLLNLISYREFLKHYSLFQDDNNTKKKDSR